MEDENTFDKTKIYRAWFKGLKDRQAKRRIQARIENAEAGNFGVVESVGEGVYEMKYRLRARLSAILFQAGEATILVVGGR